MEREELGIAPGTTLAVISHEESELVIEARYEGGAGKPPAHLHPSQDERFEVLSGSMRAVIGGEELEAHEGETLEVPRGTPHQMWNEATGPTAMRWVTSPAGRTLDWFRELAALQRGEPLSDPGTLLERYADVFRLAG